MKFIICVILCCLISFMANAAVHLGPGQNFSNIEAAVRASAIHPGDTVYLHAGSYSGWQGIDTLKGNANAWITILPYQNDLIDISGCWQFMGCEYIKLLKLRFIANSKYPGRLLNVDNRGSCATQSRNITIDSCYFTGVTDANAITALKFGGVDFFLVTNNIFNNIMACDAMDYNVCRHGIISGNIIQNCLTGGHIKGGAWDITMERNLFINGSAATWVAFEFGGDTGQQFYCPGDTFEVKDLRFYSNLIIGGYRGLALSSAVSCKVVNNTFYNCGQATLRFLTTSQLYPKLKGNIVENNIFAFGQSAYINGSSQTADAASLSNNIYYSIANPNFTGPYWDLPELKDIKENNPMIFNSNTVIFKDGANNDLSLVKGSPAIGNGKPQSEPDSDFYGNKYSAKRCIGAVEFLEPADVILMDNSNELFLFPNPAINKLNLKLNSPLNESFSLIIYDISGNEILKENIINKTGKIEFDIIHLQTGYYSLCIFQMGKSAIRKNFIITN